MQQGGGNAGTGPGHATRRSTASPGRRLLAVALAVALALVLVPGAASGAPPRDAVDLSTLPFAPITDADGQPLSTATWGVHRGAGYRIEVPNDWNGDLVVWAHGFRGDGERLFFEPEEFPLGFRQHLIEQGYAWTASTYSSNDYTVANAVLDTRTLTSFASGRIGRVDRTYLAGASMGGHVTAVAIERFPRTYDGALPVCGVMADVALFDVFLDANVAAQQLALGTSRYPVGDPVTYLTETVPAIRGALGVAPQAPFPFALSEAGERYRAIMEDRTGGPRPAFDDAFRFWYAVPEFGGGGPGNFLFELGIGDGTVGGTRGSVPSNVDTTYRFDTTAGAPLSDAEVAFNDSIVRVDRAPQGRPSPGLREVPAVRGTPSVPVLTLHNLGDLFVPVHNQVLYAERVADAGLEDRLVQRAVRGAGHCDFDASEYITAFDDLVAWVEDGVVPAGDDWLDAEARLDPDFGCTFTQVPKFAGLTAIGGQRIDTC
jgi:hypothetical protein